MKEEQTDVVGNSVRNLNHICLFFLHTQVDLMRHLLARLQKRMVGFKKHHHNPPAKVGQVVQPISDRSNRMELCKDLWLDEVREEHGILLAEPLILLLFILNHKKCIPRRSTKTKWKDGLSFNGMAVGQERNGGARKGGWRCYGQKGQRSGWWAQWPCESAV
eukprot:CAMPEP_0170541616 /NCGR_PEP_ID=MMETSP0211-20121228/1309_1 /TAXON_ID=311385 /ORGANISM="Pseudokeronopsis sp., Strain OXSARD2" /LENGTH=161 /DNA_ID=CAMNT_0010844423 /DNA_START=1 /DNA_END=487 /DNA_ORIENTATION=-